MDAEHRPVIRCREMARLAAGTWPSRGQGPAVRTPPSAGGGELLTWMAE